MLYCIIIIYDTRGECLQTVSPSSRPIPSSPSAALRANLMPSFIYQYPSIILYAIILLFTRHIILCGDDYSPSISVQVSLVISHRPGSGTR